jgi:sugar phosphate isomerase/epimerase
MNARSQHPPLNPAIHGRVYGINRRFFLNSLSLSTALVLTRMHGELASHRWKTAVGLNGFASSERKYRREFPLKEILPFIHSTGFDGIELLEGWRVGSYPDPVNEPRRMEAFVKQYTSNGLKVFSMQTGASGAFSPERATRMQWLAGMRSKTLMAKQLGCDCLGMWPGGSLRGQSLQQAMVHLADSFRRMADIAGEHGVLAAFEIEPPFVFNTEAHLRQILELTDHVNLKTIYDPSHFDLMNGSTGRPHEMLERIGVDQIGYVHLTDTDGKRRDGGTSKHLACGDGHAQIPVSLERLKKGGFKGWIMIDAWEIPDPYDACRRGLHYIRKAMG